MKPHTLAVTLAAVAVASIFGCGVAPPQTITLASGSHLTVLEEQSDSYTDRHGVEKRVFTVQYESAQDFENPAALRSELYEVFDYYKARVDQGGYSKLDLTPMKKDLGGGWEGRPFYLQRRPSGRWIIL